jgi:hypothetical protein
VTTTAWCRVDGARWIMRRPRRRGEPRTRRRGARRAPVPPSRCVRSRWPRLGAGIPRSYRLPRRPSPPASAARRRCLVRAARLGRRAAPPRGGAVLALSDDDATRG